MQIVKEIPLNTTKLGIEAWLPKDAIILAFICKRSPIPWPLGEKRVPRDNTGLNRAYIEQATLCVEGDSDEPSEKKHFKIVATGDNIMADVKEGVTPVYIGSALFNDGVTITHLYSLEED